MPSRISVFLVIVMIVCGAHITMADDLISLTPVSSTLLGTLVDVAVDGEYAYALTAGELLTLDISGPVSPTMLHHQDTPLMTSYALLKNGDYLYVVGGYNGLFTFDVSDPLAPIHLRTDSVAGWAVNLCLDQSILYVASVNAGLTLFDVTQPDAPVFISTVSDLHTAEAVSVDGSYAYVAGSDSGLYIVDVTVPTSPFVESRIESIQDAVNLVVVDSTVFVCGKYSGDVGIVIVDASDISAPVVSSVFLPTAPAFSLLASHDTLYVAHNEGVDVIEQVGPHSLAYLTSYIDNQPVRKLQLLDTVLWGASYSWLKAITVSEDTLSLIGELSFDYSPHKVAGSDSLVIVACNNTGVYAVHVSGSGSLEVLGRIDTPGWSRDVAIKGQYAYIADGFYGLLVIDIADPTNLVIVDSLQFPGYTEAIAVDGNLACLSIEDHGLVILDISSPTTTTILGHYPLDVNTNQVAIDDTLCFLGCYDIGLLVFNIADPANPTILGQVDAYYYRALQIGGDNTLFASRNRNIRTIDYSDPTAPYVVRDFAVSNWVWDLYLHEDLLYAGIGSVDVFSNAIPGQLVELTSHLSATGFGVTSLRGYLVVAERNRLRTFSITIPDLIGGDIDCSGEGPDIADLIYLVNFMFNSGPPPPFPSTADFDCSDGIDIIDLIYLVQFMFQDGPAPVQCP